MQVRGGYVVHIGNVEGSLRVGDEVKLNVDESRRRLVMANHTGTHVLNFALRQVIGVDADQRGSLVAPDRLRFDFTNKAAMTVEQVKKTEMIANELIAKNEEIFAKESPLVVAKAVQGLRAVFEETYPDPVRVVSIGIPVEKLESDPTNPDGAKTSIEFCGGTHLKRSGHIGDFIISAEESIAKGIRRIVALTGPEASKAVKKAELLQKEVDAIAIKVDALVSQKDKTLTVKDLSRLIVELSDDVSQANIAHWKKDDLRNALKALKKRTDDVERVVKAAVVTEVTQAAKKLLAERKDEPFIVHEFKAFANSKALDGALKQVKTLAPKTAAIFFSVDFDVNKIVVLAAVPKCGVDAGLKANEWIDDISSLLDGKGGGRAESAQATGNKPSNLAEAMAKATLFAQSKLGLSAPPPANSVKPEGLTLYSPDGSIRASVALIAAQFAQKKLSVISEMDANAPFIINKFPALLDGDVHLWGTVAIASYLSPLLMGGNDLQKAQVLQWINLAEQEILPAVLSLSIKSANARARQEVVKHLAALNQLLLTRTYLVGEKVTLADVTVCCVLLPAFQKSLDASARSSCKNVMRWFNTIVQQPAVKSVIGEVTYL